MNPHIIFYRSIIQNHNIISNHPLNNTETIMENGAFAPEEQMVHIHNGFIYHIIQMCLNLCIWGKGLNKADFGMYLSPKIPLFIDYGFIERVNNSAVTIASPCVSLYLSGIADELMPLRLELSARRHVGLPGFPLCG